MRFGDKLKLRLTGAVNAFRAPTGATGGLNFVEVLSTEPYFVPPGADTLKLIELYKTSPWVRTIVHKIGRTLAKQEWYIEGKDDARIDDHPALDFLRAGTRKLRGRQAMALTTNYIDLVGEAFWGIGRSGAGLPVEYAVIPPHWVLDIPHLNYPNYKIQPRLGVIYEIEPEAILHFRDVDPVDPYGRGTGMTHAAMVELDTDKQAASFMNTFFRNRARPDIIISGTETSPIGDKDRVRAEQMWQERYRGSGKVGRPFFSTKPVSVQEVGFGLRDNQIDKIREQQRSFISEFFNIPPEILGRIDTSNRATIDSADYLFSTHVIEPRLEMLLDHLEPWCMDEFGLKAGQLTYENPAADDTQKALSIMEARPMAFTDDEFRELAGYKGLGGKHAEPPEPIAAPTPGAPGAPDGGGDPPKPKGTDAPKEGDSGAKAIAAPVSKSLTPSDIVDVSQAHEDPQVVAQATKLFDDLFAKLLEEYGAELLDELESEVTFTVNAAVADWLMQRGSDLVGQIDATTEDALKAALVTGASDDEGLDELLARVDQIFADAADTRAELIGDTEATALTGFGSYAAAKQGGFEEKQWISSHDQAVRLSHRELDGVVVPLDTPFQSKESGATAQFPGDFGDASEDINCRCAIRPVLPGEDTGDGKAITGKPSFAKWHKSVRDRMKASVKAKSAAIFAAQAEVVKTHLRRTMARHAA